MRTIGKHAALGAAYGELDKNGVTNLDAAVFTIQEVQVAGIVRDYTGWPVEKMTRQMSFSEIEGCDSLDVVQVIMDCEDKFGIEISDAEAEGIRTLADLFAVVAKHRP